MSHYKKAITILKSITNAELVGNVYKLAMEHPSLFVQLSGKSGEFVLEHEMFNLLNSPVELVKTIRQRYNLGLKESNDIRKFVEGVDEIAFDRPHVKTIAVNLRGKFNLIRKGY